MFWPASHLVSVFSYNLNKENILWIQLLEGSQIFDIFDLAEYYKLR